MASISGDIELLILIVALILVPRLLQRFRVPAPITSFGLGMTASWVLGDQSQDSTLSLLATLGISTLFLFAGLEVEIADFKRSRWPLIRHMVLRIALIAGSTWVLTHWLDFDWLSWQSGTLLALAVLTPSAGFILDTLSALRLNEEEQYWIRMKAISGELLALVVLFVVLKSQTLIGLALSTAALVAILVALPLILIALGRFVVPFAAGSEFSLLVMVGVISAFVTYKLGVYYLVGAFLAGFVAKLLRGRMPGLASEVNLHAVRMFASFFVPFYFFHKGMGVPDGAWSIGAIGLGLAIAAFLLPARVGLMWIQRRLIKGETPLASLRVSAALTPTLIFTLVLATILRERFGIPDLLYGGLLVYAGLSTILPAVVIKSPVEFALFADAKPMPESPVAAAEVRR